MESQSYQSYFSLFESRVGLLGCRAFIHPLTLLAKKVNVIEYIVGQHYFSLFESRVGLLDCRVFIHPLTLLAKKVNVIEHIVGQHYMTLR